MENMNAVLTCFESIEFDEDDTMTCVSPFAGTEAFKDEETDRWCISSFDILVSINMNDIPVSNMDYDFVILVREHGTEDEPVTLDDFYIPNDELQCNHTFHHVVSIDSGIDFSGIVDDEHIQAAVGNSHILIELDLILAVRTRHSDVSYYCGDNYSFQSMTVIGATLIEE